MTDDKGADMDQLHMSDCAVHNEPAFPKGACDCGASVVAVKPYTAVPCELHSFCLQLTLPNGVVLCGKPYSQDMWCDALNDAHSAGVKAERERCAHIAEHEAGEISECMTGRIIAGKIRGGQDGE